MPDRPKLGDAFQAPLAHFLARRHEEESGRQGGDSRALVQIGGEERSHRVERYSCFDVGAIGISRPL
jgi:hypothetical protein